MKELAGRTAVVTGAASGIGRSMARRFAVAGMNVVLADLDPAPLNRVVAEIAEAGGNAIGVPTDVSSQVAVSALAKRSAERFGQVQLLCNNAGIGGSWGKLSEYEQGDWDRVLRVNLWGVIHGLRAFLPAMLSQRDETHVVNTVSTAGLTISPYLPAYTVSKFAAMGLSEVLFHQMQAEGGRVGVSVLCPGPVDTNGWETVTSLSSAEGDGQESVKSALGSGIDPDRVAEVVEAAIRERQFYVFTHPEWLPIFEQRAQNILLQTNPSVDVRWGASASGAGA